MKQKISLHDERRKRKLTQQQLADMLGVSREYIALLETGKRKMSKKFIDKFTSLFTDVNLYIDMVQEESQEYDVNNIAATLFETEQIVKQLQSKLDEKEAVIKSLTHAVEHLSNTLNNMGNEKNTFTLPRSLSSENKTSEALIKKKI